MGTRFDVFLSHSAHDKSQVHALYDALRALDLAVFLDEQHVGVGDSLYSALNKVLEASDFVVFCISRASVSSWWVDREVGGSLATQVTGQRKKILPVLLDDAPIPPLLADLVWLDMAKASPAAVAAQIKTAITAARASRLRASPYPYDVREQVDHAISLITGQRVAPSFCWAIISGPSSAGKDVLSYVAVQRLQQRHGLSFLRKMTTRPRRPSEPDYVEQIEEPEFERRFRAGEIMFPFRKRTFRYGFDGRQFRRAIREGTPLLSVFTEFRLVPALAEAMNAAGVRTAPFLIYTKKADVLRRVLFRNLPSEEVASRIASIEQDYEEMSRRASLDGEYVFIKNGDETAFREASTELVEAIRAMIQSDARRGKV